MARAFNTGLVHNAGPAQEFLWDVLNGLSQRQKELPCKYLYDARGSELFEEICATEDYYPTRAELALMREHREDICACVGSREILIELGSGAGVKTRLLLDSLADVSLYVPVDISGELLRETASSLRCAYPAVRVLPLEADYTRTLKMPPEVEGSSATLYFPGSTIGNFHPTEAEAFLRRLTGWAGARGALVIGVDLVKDPERLVRAYDDSAGVTAAFNLNVLKRINRELKGTFPLAQFRHLARWNPNARRMEMHLCSLDRQEVRVAADYAFSFERGETIWTESSYKYTVAGFIQLAERAGWRSGRVWTDPERLFSVHYLEVVSARGRMDDGPPFRGGAD